MKISRSIILSLIILVFFISGNSFAGATLGTSPDENKAIYGDAKKEPKYHFKGQKNAYIYKKNNAVITVIYRDGVSILENISYLIPIEKSLAEKDMKEMMLPESNNKAQFTDTMPYGDAYFKENIYKEGIKTKIIFDSSGNVKEIIASLDKLKKEQETNEEE